MCTPVGLNATLVSQNITQVNLNIAPVSLRVALNDGYGNPVQLKSLQSAVCISSLVCSLHFTSLRTLTHFRLLLQSAFYFLSAFNPRSAVCSLNAIAFVSHWPSYYTFPAPHPQTICTVYMNSYSKWSKIQNSFSKSSKDCPKIKVPPFLTNLWIFSTDVPCLLRGIVKNFILSPRNKRYIMLRNTPLLK